MLVEAGLIVMTAMLVVCLACDARDAWRADKERSEFFARVDAAIDAQRASDRVQRMGVARWAWDADGREVE